MEASENLYQLPQYHNSLSPRDGVITLFGYGIQVRVDRGHLLLEDGIGTDRSVKRLPRVGHGLRRLVVIGSDGMVSLAALRWLADQNAAFVMLERNGSVLATTGPVRSYDARLRRAQSLSVHLGNALYIARELIDKKLAGQEKVARDQLLANQCASAISSHRATLAEAKSLNDVRQIESKAAALYWSSWNNLPINFPRNEISRIPEHWRTFGTRKSVLSGSQRLAVTPPNAILNYLYSLLESEATLAASAMGLDPGIGVLHMDTRARDSLACDLMEPIRPQIDSYLLTWILNDRFKREWFFEQRNGNCRLMGSFARRLAETAPTWGRAVAPFAEFVAHQLWSTTAKPDSQAAPATRLTGSNKRKIVVGSSGRLGDATARLQKTCLVCGIGIRARRNYCSNCAIATSREQMSDVAKIGRKLAHTLEAQDRRSETQRRHGAAKKNWTSSSLPAWLTKEVYEQKILPSLSKITHAAIASELGISLYYAIDIRRGRRCPHPPHWQALARLTCVVGIF